MTTKHSYNFTNLTNKRFGRLKVIKQAPTRNYHNLRWECYCDPKFGGCGKSVDVLGSSLTSGKTKSCRCLQYKRPYQWCYTRLKNVSRYPVKLTYEEFFEFTKVTRCHYCNSEVVWNLHNRGINGNHNKYNLDRKDNSLGYSKDNCVVCCWRCNDGKGSRFTYEEWYGMTQYFRNTAPVFY